MCHVQYRRVAIPWLWFEPIQLVVLDSHQFVSDRALIKAKSEYWRCGAYSITCAGFHVNRSAFYAALCSALPATFASEPGSSRCPVPWRICLRPKVGRFDCGAEEKQRGGFAHACHRNGFQEGCTGAYTACVVVIFQCVWCSPSYPDGWNESCLPKHKRLRCRCRVFMANINPNNSLWQLGSL